MKILNRLTAIHSENVRADLKFKLILYYLIGGSLALVTNLLMSSGLDFNAEQLRLITTKVFPISVVSCILADIPLILFFARPIDAFLKRVDQGGAPDRHMGDQAFSRAINLPLISVFRVEFIHLPIGLILNIAPLIVVDACGIMEFSVAHYAAITGLGLINGTIHSIVEYYFISRLMKDLLGRMHGHYSSFRLESGGIIFVNAKVKFYFIYFLIAVMPLIFLGSTVLFKSMTFFAETGISGDLLLKELIPWVAVFVLISSVTSFLMAYILSREIIDPVSELMHAMKRVEKGMFDERLLVTTADEFSGLYDGFNMMTEGLGEREIIKKKFGKYVSDKLLGDILGNEPELGGVEKTVTILFSDIRNYTGMSEGMSPTQTVHFLNEYFSAMVKIIEEHNGLLDKFIGDAVMAIFGAPVDDPDHAANALSAAIGMQAQLEIFNEERRQNGDASIDIGIGLCSGKVLVGNIGSETRMEYTVIGDAVNLASRIETLTKEAGHRILFSDSTNEMVKDNFPSVLIGSFDIKGKKEPCAVYTVEV